jgi:poly(3-hydroxybutyrate) depolymerase
MHQNLARNYLSTTLQLLGCAHTMAFIRVLLLLLVLGQETQGFQSPLLNQSVGTVEDHTISVGGTERSYLLFLPQNYAALQTGSAKLRSLILSFHGGGRDAQRQLQLDHLSDPFFNTKTIVVYPQGINVRHHVRSEYTDFQGYMARSAKLAC